MNAYVELLDTLNGENQSEFKEKCNLIAKGIQSGSFAVIQLIEELKQFLVNPSPSKREQGVFILSEVLRNLPPDFLNEQQLKIISVFYKERLSDHHQVIPVVLKGILKLVEFKHFPEEAISPLLTTIFHNVACQQQQQADRYTNYEIFQLSSEKFKNALRSMGPDLVYGVISSIDGERDPRNLMFLFKWLKRFITVIPLGHLKEEMFEVMACYFPVDFKTPPSGTTEVTRDDLAYELSQCLSAIPQFSEYAIPLALEKLDSSLIIAKLDSLSLLQEGCSAFPPESYLLYATEIWSQLQKEVFGDVENDVNMQCLNTVTVVINKISEPHTEPFVSVLSNIVGTLKGNLLPESKLFQPSISILLHTALGSRYSSNYVVDEIVPLLTNTFAISNDASQKAVLLTTLVRFVEVYGRRNTDDNDRLVDVPALCLKACTETETKLREAGFSAIAELADTLSLDIRMTVCKYLHSLIIRPESSDVRACILKCFKVLSASYPDEIDSYVLHKSKISDDSVLDLYLQALCFIADNRYFRGTVCDWLLSYAVNDISSTMIAVKHMWTLLIFEKDDAELTGMFIQRNAVDKLVRYSVEKIHYGTDTIDLLKQVAYILKILIGSQSVEVQNEIVRRQLSVIDGCKQSEELYVLLLDGIISRIRTGLTPDASTLSFLTKLSVMNGCNTVRDVSNQLLANLLNKHPDGDSFNGCLDSVKRDCLFFIDGHRSNVMITFSWITKALVMRNHREADHWIDALLRYLEEDSTVAIGFRLIMNDDYESLGAVSHCDRKLLYQQKFFTLLIDKICNNFSQGKESYLIALGYLVEHVSEQVLLLHFKKISRFVILCMEQCSDPKVLHVILKRIENIIITDESILEGNLEDILMRILRLAAYEHSMKVRIAALQCITQFSSLPLYRILPLKQKVLQHLEPCIDDKKRLVRKEATVARNLWYLLDAPM